MHGAVVKHYMKSSETHGSVKEKYLGRNKQRLSGGREGCRKAYPSGAMRVQSITGLDPARAGGRAQYSAFGQEAGEEQGRKIRPGFTCLPVRHGKKLFILEQIANG